MKKIFIHCGLYKTGTTSLQKYLFDNRANLKKLGLLYPNAGIPHNSTAHHHIARELNPAVLSDSKTGTISRLIREISQFPGNVVISSEFFADALIYPRRMDSLVSLLLASQFRPVLVIYLRDLFSYLESLYMQLLRDGYTNDYDTYLHRALEYGIIYYRDLETSIDYHKIKSAVENNAGVDVIFRDYNNLVDNSSIADFMDLIGIAGKQEDFSQPTIKLNSRESLEIGLRRFHFNRTRLLELQYDKLVASEAGEAFILINKMCDMDFSGFITPEAHKAPFRHKYLTDCQGLLATPHHPEPVARSRVNNENTSTVDDRFVDISRFFSIHTAHMIQNSSAALHQFHADKHEQVKKLVESNIQSWRSWVRSRA